MRDCASENPALPLRAAPWIPGLRLTAHPGMTADVDLIFTTSLDASFTKAFDAKSKTRAIAFLCRARNAD
jgi:hypothetical protein